MRKRIPVQRKRKQGDTLPKQRVTSPGGAQEPILGRKVPWLLSHTYEHGTAESDRESTKALLPLRPGLAPISFFALAAGSGLTAHPGINPG
jgi:hypothetical protein